MTANNYDNGQSDQQGEGVVWSADKLFQATYKDLGEPIEVENRFLQHLLSSEQCRRDLDALLHESSSISRDFSVPVDAFDLIQRDPILGYMLLQYPSTLLPLLENAVVLAQRELIREQAEPNLDTGIAGEENDKNSTKQNATVKGSKKGDDDASNTTTRVHARLVHLPPQCCKMSLGRLEASDVGKIWQVTGTVVRVGPVQMYESARTYKCTGVGASSGARWAMSRKGGAGGSGNGNSGNNRSKQKDKQKWCGRTFTVHADLEQTNNALQQPDRCPLQLPGGNRERCPGNKFRIDPEGSVHTDYQEIKIQEAAGGGGLDTIPRSLLIKLQHDLVDRCTPGEEVVVVGILIPIWPQNCNQPDVECHVGMAMSAHSIRVVADHGASAWRQSGSGQNNHQSSNSVGEMEKFRKEFEAYWKKESSLENPIQARDFICKAVCPKLYGLQVIKLALLLTLIGGVSSEVYQTNRNNIDESNLQGKQSNHSEFDDIEESTGPDAFELALDEPNQRKSRANAYHVDQNQQRKNDQQSESTTRKRKREAVKTRRRDQSHLLLVGDPGTGKSQVLRFAAALCPRSVLTTGIGTTSAGLTCAAVRESGGNGKEFALEAGALVLADKGVCCIDEFGCIQQSDRTTIHEAMEQQTLSVAKAGIVCKLNCRATIIAVMNPRDCLYDNHASLAANTGLGTPLLSRFDLIFKLVDTSDAERDSNVTTYLLNRAIQGAGFDVGTNENEGNHDTENDFVSNDRECSPWGMEKLRAYISVVKEGFQPVMSNDAALLLERHYEKCRSQVSNTIPVTVRFLESLIRLCQAHARLMHRNIVTLQDAVAVIQVMECTAFAYGGFDGVDAVDYCNVMYRDPMTTDFSCEADIDFLCFEYRILERYGMLEHVDNDRRSNAAAALKSTAFGLNAGGKWEMLEQTRDHGWDYHHENGIHAATQGTEQWTIPSQPPVTQDHYGRTYFQSQNKRNRI